MRFHWVWWNHLSMTISGDLKECSKLHRLGGWSNMCGWSNVTAWPGATRQSTSRLAVGNRLHKWILWMSVPFECALKWHDIGRTWSSWASWWPYKNRRISSSRKIMWIIMYVDEYSRTTNITNYIYCNYIGEQICCFFMFFIVLTCIDCGIPTIVPQPSPIRQKIRLSLWDALADAWKLPSAQKMDPIRACASLRSGPGSWS